MNTKWEISNESKTVQASPCLLTCPVAGFSFVAIMAFPGGRLSFQLRIERNTLCLVSHYDPADKRHIVVSTTDQVTANGHAFVTSILRQDECNIVLCYTWHVQVIRQNPANCLPLHKTYVPLKHTLWPKASTPYNCLITWKISLSDLPNFWQNFTLLKRRHSRVPPFAFKCHSKQRS